VVPVEERDCNRIVESFFGAARRECPCEMIPEDGVLRAYPWWPHTFVHLEATWESRRDCWAWEFSYLGTGYSVHFDCRHREIDVQYVLARGLEKRLVLLKRGLGQDIYVPGRYRKSENELRVLEDMARIPRSDDAPALVGCRLAQYAITLRAPVTGLLTEAGYLPEPSPAISNLANVSDLATGLPSTHIIKPGSRSSGHSRSRLRHVILNRRPRTTTPSRSR